MPLPLEGIGIIDLSWQGPGPYCTMLLADLGADVIKVEEPGVSGRRAGLAPGAATPDRSNPYGAYNRNKRSITLNLKSEAARQVFYALSRTADVVVEGFRPGVSARLGVDYPTVKELNPKIVYCSVTGYGQNGPYRSLAGHDINYIATAGVLGVVGKKGGPPVIPGNLLADFGGGGMHAVMGILTALLVRERTGIGQYVDVSLMDSVISLLGQFFGGYFATGVASGRGEHRLTGGYPYYNVYETKDGKYISIGSNEPWLFAGLCKALGREDLVEHQENLEKHEEIFAFFAETFKTRTRDEWFDYLREFDNCVAPVYTMDEVIQDPQVQARNMFVELDHPTLGKVKHVGVSPKFSETPGAVRTLPPSRGQHTNEILGSLGYAENDIRALREQGAI